MSDTALDHPAVRDYLRAVDAALAGLAPGPARELREQIAAHLDDALAPDSDDEAVAEVLRRLGAPADLAAEARISAGSASAVTLGQVARKARLGLVARLARLSRRRKALLAVAVLLAVTGTALVVAAQTAAPLRFNALQSWWNRQDALHAVDTSADGSQQTTVHVRSGQRQGFVFWLYNASNFTQTVVGLAPEGFAPFGTNMQIGVATADPQPGGGYFRSYRYTSPGSIPPHQGRIVRLMWTSTTCLAKGTAEGSDQVRLRVRIGLVYRTEAIDLGAGWYLSGPSAPQNAAGDCV